MLFSLGNVVCTIGWIDSCLLRIDCNSSSLLSCSIPYLLAVGNFIVYRDGEATFDTFGIFHVPSSAFLFPREKMIPFSSCMHPPGGLIVVVLVSPVLAPFQLHRCWGCA